MRLLVASHSAAEDGGAELSLHELVEGLAARDGVRLHVVLPWAGGLLERLRGLGVETSLEPHLRGWVRAPGSERQPLRHVAGHVLGVLGLIRLARRVGPDAVITNTLTIPGAAVAARVLGVPHIWYVHEFGLRDHGFSFDLGYARSLRLVEHLSERIVVNSRAVLEEMSRWIDRDKLRLVHYGVCVPARPGEPAPRAGDAWNVVLVGRKSPSKGQEDAIRALAVLRESGERVTLRLVGGGDPAYLPRLEALARELGVADSLVLVPETRDVFAHFAWADVALVCSRAEAFGRVTVEAMKMGRPVVGARSGGTAELIRDGWNGLLYQPGDSRELAAKIQLLRRRPEVAARLAATARSWAEEQFSGERYAAAFAAVVEEVLGAPAPKPAARADDDASRA